MRTTLVGSWPPAAQYSADLARYHSGHLEHDRAELLLTEVANECYGDFGARTWTRNRSLRPLLPTLHRLTGSIDRLVLELSLAEQCSDRQLRQEIDESIEIGAGIIDVKSPRTQTVDELAAMTDDLLRVLPPERLLLCPSCGFGRRWPQLAIDKTSVMVACARRF